MNIRIHLALVLLFFASIALAGEASQQATNDAPASELIALVEDWIDAEVEDDRETLERLLHDEFLSTFASGVTLGKTAYIDFIIGLDIAPFKVINEEIRIHGDTAVVIDVSEDGGTKFTWIAVRRSGQWQVIAQTFSSVDIER